MKKLYALFIAFAMAMSLLSSCTSAPETPSPAETDAPGETPLPALASVPAPSPASMPEPTPEPSPPPEPELAPEPTPDAADAPPSPSPPASKITRNDAYFDNTVLIGDSLMEGIRQYVAMRRKTETTLGEAKFLASTAGISIADLVGDRQIGRYYVYKGEEKPLQDILVEMDISRIFVMIGLNDLAAEDAVVENIVDRYDRLIGLLYETVPGVDIIVMTNTPKVKSSWLPGYTANRNFGNPLIDSFVEALIGLCDANGIAYIDTNQLLKDGDGALPDDYCRDGFAHINNKGAEVVVNALYAFADDQR